MSRQVGTGFLVKAPGPRTLIQDLGRFGHHGLGLTTGGPADPLAFRWANRLCHNELNRTALEVSVGGLVLEAQADTRLAVCGANMPLKINGIRHSLWCSYEVKAGDIIELGFASEGNFTYLSVAGGFDIEPTFGSTSTVTREGIGGLCGTQLRVSDFLPCHEVEPEPCLLLPQGYRPAYGHHAMLRVILGYQQSHFSRHQKRRFFSNEFRVSLRTDRMGCCLEGPTIKPDIDGILSEGICLGAIQFPPDGQPIVLMNDRQTIGGYPKLGSVLSLDLARLSQLKPGDRVSFEPITVEDAHNINHLAEAYFHQITPIPVKQPVSDLA